MNDNEEINMIEVGIIITAIFFSVFLLFGCCSKQITESETRVDTVYIYQTYTDTLTLSLCDTVWQAGDERLVLKIDTLWKKVWYKMTIRDTVTHTDSVIIYRPAPIIEKTWLEEMMVYLFPVFGGIILILIFIIWLRK